MTGNPSPIGPVRRFRNQRDWAAWLEKNHRRRPGIWLRLAKKGSGLQSITYGEALESALCYGWIDGQKRPENERTWLQRFLPRSAQSVWSKINRRKALALIASGRMKAAGFAAIAEAKAKGRWQAAYDSMRRAAVPEDFQSALDSNPRAYSFFKELDSANRYAILFRIQTAKKTETRSRKIQQFIAMLEGEETIHPRRRKR
jgi:uncharacterized protein YdeI (YjbR/CyaY-like superfamily)